MKSPLSFVILASIVCAAAVDSSTATPSTATETSISGIHGDLNSVSVFAILATALPTSLLNLAITDPAEATNVIASEFAADETPSWFTHLPENVKTYLLPVTTIEQASSELSSNLSTQATNLQTIVLPSDPAHPNTTLHRNHTIFHNSTMLRTSAYSLPALTSTMMTTGGGGAIFTKSSSSTSSQGGAAVPTAMIGASIAGVVGLVGVLAL